MLKMSHSYHFTGSSSCGVFSPFLVSGGGGVGMEGGLAEEADTRENSLWRGMLGKEYNQCTYDIEIAKMVKTLQGFLSPPA